MVTGFTMLVMFGTLSLFGKNIIENCKELLAMFLGAGESIPVALDVQSTGLLMLKAILQLGKIMLPIFIAALLSAFVFNIMQVGFLFTTEPMAPKFSRISMGQGFKRIFSLNTLVVLLKSVLKIVIVAYLGYSEYLVLSETLPTLMNYSFVGAIATIAQMLLSIGFKISIALAIIGPMDYLYEWWRHEKDLRMSKQEIKDEYKLTEGNPEIKGRIKQKQREMSAMRTMQAMGEADVIITNPTHYAVAVKYDEDINDAPIVLAKGKDFMAQRMKEKAKELEITMVENRKVAQSLFFFCEVGDEVPEELYQAIAEILAYVYQLKHGKQGVRQ